MKLRSFDGDESVPGSFLPCDVVDETSRESAHVTGIGGEITVPASPCGITTAALPASRRARRLFYVPGDRVVRQQVSKL